MCIRDSESTWSAPPVVLDPEPSGKGRVETYTIGHDRDGTPNQGIIVGRLEETDARFLANTPPDPDLLAALETREVIGMTGRVEVQDGIGVFRPA